MQTSIQQTYDNGVSRCVLTYRTTSGLIIHGIGIAECHPDDEDFMSELTGGTIAEYRAEIDLIKQINNYEIKPSIAALKHVFCTMRHSKQYNPDSCEARRIKKELAHLMDELEENKNAIKDLKETLKKYINDKDKLYKQLRKGKNQ